MTAAAANFGFSTDFIRRQAARVRRAGLAALKPPERLSVAEWAEKRLILSERVSPAYPGPIRLDRSPYMREILDSLSDRNVEEITLAKAAQVGYTLALLTMIGYAIDQDPGPALLVMPSENLAKSISKTRLQPLVDDSPALATHKPADEDDYTLLEMQFDRMTLALVGANSPANLASRPIRYLFLDEVDKYPGAMKDEAAAADLALMRTRSFWNRKIVRGSTPTVLLGEVWRAFLRGDQRYYWVPCPHCGEKQKLTFGQVKWPEAAKIDGGCGWDIDLVKRSSWYECVQCGPAFPIRDWHKPRMVAKGEWRPEGRSGSHRSYHLSALYPTWVRFGDITAEFLESKQYPDKLRNFVNSTLAEIWEERGEAATDEQVLACRSTYDFGTCPINDPVAVVITADHQKAANYYEVWAYDRHETGYLLRYGSVPAGFEALLEVGRGRYATPNGQKVMATHGLIDSGYDSDDVYRFALDNNWTAVKGSDSTRQSQPYRWSEVSIGDAADAPKVNLLHLQTDFFKESVHNRIRRTVANKEMYGAWLLPKQTSLDFAQQITAETPIEDVDKKWGKIKRRWKRLRRANHFLDCEVLQAAAVLVLGVRNMPDPSEVRQPLAIAGQKRRDGREFLDIKR